ncbi:unnamed protein product [Phaeothamnion confervicola]
MQDSREKPFLRKFLPMQRTFQRSSNLFVEKAVPLLIFAGFDHCNPPSGIQQFSFWSFSLQRTRLIKRDPEAGKIMGTKKLRNLGLIAAGKPKDGCVNVRFNVIGESGKGQCAAQTEDGKLVRCWVDLDAGWGRRIYILGQPQF